MNTWQIGVFVIAGLIDHSTVTGDGALRLTNVNIQMVKIGLVQIEARVTNPNEFAEYDVLASCDFRGRYGQTVSTLGFKVAAVPKPRLQGGIAKSYASNEG
jgi:hypothetical protein